MFSISRQVVRQVTTVTSLASVKDKTYQLPLFSKRCFQTLLLDQKWIRNHDDAQKQPSSATSSMRHLASQSNNNAARILLLDADEKKIGQMTLSDAQHLAKKKDLKLIKLEPPTGKYKQDVYQLLTGTQLHQQRMKQKEAKKANSSVNKGDKLLIIGAKITPHDLNVKIKTIKKWLQHSHHIRVTIQNDTSDFAERTYGELEKAAMEFGCRILQKHKATDGSTIKFTLQLDKKIEQLPPSS